MLGCISSKYPWFCFIPECSQILTSTKNELFYKLFSDAYWSQMPLPCKFPLRSFLVLADIPELSESGLFLLSSPGTGSHSLASAEGSPQPHSSGHHYKIKGSKLSVFFVVPKLRKSQDWQQDPLSIPGQPLKPSGTSLIGLCLLYILQCPPWVPNKKMDQSPLP